MKRHYYISNDLDDLEVVGQELLEANITKLQFHVLSNDDAQVNKHDLHEVEAVLKKDVVHSTEIGAVVGIIAAAAVLLIAHFTGATNSAAGWIPFIFLAIVMLGFCTWEGGLIGIQIPNYQFAQFKDVLDKGKHVFFVDIDDNQEPALNKIVKHHPSMELAGFGEPTPRWVIRTQDNYQAFVKFMP